MLISESEFKRYGTLQDLAVALPQLLPRYAIFENYLWAYSLWFEVTFIGNDVSYHWS